MISLIMLNNTDRGNMTKELKALNNLYARASVNCPIDEISIILDELHIIEKSLKALKIIRRESNVVLDICWRCCKTKEEFDLLKKVLS